MSLSLSIQIQDRHQHVQFLGLLGGFNDGGRFVKGKTNELVRQRQQVGIANAARNVQRHVVVLRHFHHILHFLEQFLRLLGLSIERLRQNHREQVGAFGTQGAANGGSVRAARARGVHVVARQDQSVGAA